MKEFRISDEAVRQLRVLRDASVEARPEHAVRVFMNMGFCGGAQWGFSLDTYSEEDDECCDFDGLRIIVARDLLEAMGGLDISLMEDDDEESDSFLVLPLDPEVNAFLGQTRGGCGGCHGGGCGGCHGGCGCHAHGEASDACCGYDCDGECGHCDGECGHCDGECGHCDGECGHCGGECGHCDGDCL